MKKVTLLTSLGVLISIIFITTIFVNQRLPFKVFAVDDPSQAANPAVGAFTTDAPPAIVAFSSFPTAADRDAAERQLEEGRLSLAKAVALLADVDNGINTTVPRPEALAAKNQAETHFNEVLAKVDAINVALGALAQASDQEIAAQKAAQDQLTASIDSALSSGNIAALRTALRSAFALHSHFFGAAVAASDLVTSRSLDEAISEAMLARSTSPVDERSGIAATITILTGGTLKQAAENASKQGGLLAYAATMASDQNFSTGVDPVIIEKLATEVVTFASEQAKKNNTQINMADVVNSLTAVNISQTTAIQIIAQITRVDPATITKTIIATMQASIVEAARLSGAFSGIPNSPEALAAARGPKPPATPTPVVGPQYVAPPQASGNWPESSYAFPVQGGIGGTTVTASGKTQNGIFTEGMINYQVTNSNGGTATTRVNLAAAPISVISSLLQNPTAAEFNQWIAQNSFTVQPDGTFKR